MRITYKIFLRALVREFYEQNAGFFMLVIALAFGFMSGVEHKALAGLIISSEITLLIPAAVWAFYLFKIVSFNNQQLALEQNHFLFNLSLTNRKESATVQLFTIVLQFKPAILYAVFLIYIAIVNNQLVIAALVVLLNIAFIIIGWFSLRTSLRYPIYSKSVNSVEKILNARLKRGLVRLYVEWFLRKEWMAFFGIKALSCAILFGTMHLYTTDTYDLRLAALGTMMAFSTNIVVLKQFQLFELGHFSIIRNMPITLAKRFALTMASFSILCFPEIVLIHHYYPENFSSFSMILNIAFGVSTGVLFNGLIYKIISEESMIKYLLGIFIMWFILILFKIPIVVLLSINIILGYALYSRNYYSFQAKLNV